MNLPIAIYKLFFHFIISIFALLNNTETILKNNNYNELINLNNNHNLQI